MGLSEVALREICPYVRLARLEEQEIIFCNKNCGKSPDSDIKLENKIKIGERGVCRATMFYHDKNDLKIEINIDNLYECPYRRN
ncbi:hypothetical protein M0R19_02985 [Candidatus Pacearchaeota archaeon]|jgi:hypothetical protein|nr:hypothetical protein [Candidatus Pacearchaeota archaeon]